MAYQQYTLAEIRAMLEDRWDDVPFWTDVEANNAINEALKVWNGLTGFWKTLDTIDTTPLNFEYAVPATITFGMRVRFNGKALTQTSLNEMDSARPNWQSQTTATPGVPSEPKVWMPISLSTIAIWPADAVGGGVLAFDGVATTPVLKADGDYIAIGADELNVLVGYALHAAAFKEGGERFEATMKYLKDFLEAASIENDQLLKSSMFRKFMGIDAQKKEVPTKS